MELLARGAAALGIELDGGQMDQFHRYYLELIEWNRRVNLTAVTEWEQVQTRHYLDSLSVTSALPEGMLQRRTTVLDVGSGAGLPGLPLKIAFPTIRITLVEAVRKKTRFLEHLVRELGLDDAKVLAGRAETLAHDPALRERYRLVLSRAVARLSTLAELCLPFCSVGGLVVAQKAAGIDDEIDLSANAVEAMGGRLKGVTEVTYEGSEGTKTLVVLEKHTPTPERYPRRPGMPAKRPL